MEHHMCHLKELSRDILADIFVRTDGSTLASAACACCELHDVARDQSLWRQLCRATWPSTALEEAQHVISSSPIGGFDKFYAYSYPLILHAKGTKPMPFKCPELKTHVSPSELASLVDVYFRKECVLSKVLDGIPEAMNFSHAKDSEYNWNMNSNDCWRWYSNCPFKLELLSLDYDKFTGFYNESYANNENDNHCHGLDANDEGRGFPSTSGVDDENLRHDYSMELMESLRLSWVLLDKKNGRSVNLSSWKPLLVQKTWPFHGVYLIHFGSIVAVEESLLPHKLSKCIIIVRCKMTEGEGCPKWMEISMQMEDLTGASVSGSKGLMVLNHALNCLQSSNHLEVEQGFHQYEKKRREMMKKKQFRETLIDSFCVTIEITVLVVFCYYFFIF
ncbi:probable F-box protein At2g36090 [Quercus lobata]|uniref:probable F-box protein At2g36090 n=1 Tax=Quercus lobata TaxID=97700 RepID=UPI001248E2DB|nr:probable F-box protein At2g36090 [Quercus lobata]